VSDVMRRLSNGHSEFVPRDKSDLREWNDPNAVSDLNDRIGPIDMTEETRRTIKKTIKVAEML